VPAGYDPLHPPQVRPGLEPDVDSVPEGDTRVRHLHQPAMPVAA
jgi:hypothetical protein